jgi:transcriptional regulator
VTAKLTEEDVRTIRRLRTNGKTQQEIANMFDITQATVSSILLRKSWSWLED